MVVILCFIIRKEEFTSFPLLFVVAGVCRSGLSQFLDVHSFVLQTIRPKYQAKILNVEVKSFLYLVFCLVGSGRGGQSSGSISSNRSNNSSPVLAPRLRGRKTSLSFFSLAAYASEPQTSPKRLSNAIFACRLFFRRLGLV